MDTHYKLHNLGLKRCFLGYVQLKHCPACFYNHGANSVLCACVVSFSVNASVFSVNICSLVTWYSLIRLRVHSSYTHNFVITPTYNVWRYSLGSVARLRIIFFRVLMMTLSSANYALNDHSHSVTTQRSTDLTISTSWLVPRTRLACAALTCAMPTWILLVWIHSLCRSF